MIMWKKSFFNSHHNHCDNHSLDVNSHYQMNADGTKTNMDCIIHILSQLSINDRVNCRLVCKSWRDAIDKIFSGQRSLRVIMETKKCGYKFLKSKNSLTASKTFMIRKPMKFQLFHHMLINFPSLHSLIIRDLPLSDVMILAITAACPMLMEIKFYNCGYTYDNTDDNHNDNQQNHQLTSYAWTLIIRGYPLLRQLTLRNCSLIESDCEMIISNLTSLQTLDIADNGQLSGECLRQLSDNCHSLCVGNLNSDQFVEPLLNAIVESEHGWCLKRLELRGGINSPLNQIKKLTSLESLTLKFFCPQDQVIDTLSPIGKLTALRQLVLNQERCYDEPSAIDVHSFTTIVRGCPLEKFVISGEYGWRLRLNDDVIHLMADNCQLLTIFSLTGNSPDITDACAQSLVSLPNLRSVSLTSFEKITDSGLIHLISRHRSLDYIGIKETTSISNATLNACIELAKSEPNRRLSVSFAETKISRPKIAKIPDNLKVVFEDNLRPRRQSDEPSAIKMIAVVGMSAIILAMILITMLVVIVMPVGMLLIMLYDHCLDWAIDSADIPLERNAIDVLTYYTYQSIDTMRGKLITY